MDFILSFLLAFVYVFGMHYIADNAQNPIILMALLSFGFLFLLFMLIKLKWQNKIYFC